MTTHHSVGNSLLPSVPTTETEDKRVKVANLQAAHDHVIDCEGDLILENVLDSTIRVNGLPSSIVINSVKNSTITAYCNGSVNIFKCTDTVVKVSAHQIRIHEASDCLFKISCQGGCIVEDCQRLKFGPLSSEQDESTWKGVQDFTSFDQDSFQYIN